MLRLRKCLLAAVRSPSPLPAAPAASLHRYILPFSIATASPAPFDATDYLVTTCGLTPAQALKSSKYLAHVKSPAKADAVLAVLADAGISKGAVAAAVAGYPRLLCCKVHKTLSPRIAMLRDIGLSSAQISSLFSIIHDIFWRPQLIEHLRFYISFLGSFDNVHAALKRRRRILNPNIERVVKPNISFLRQCGLADSDISKIFSLASGLFLLKPERMEEIVACVDRLGVPRGSTMFKYGLISVYNIGPERVDERLGLFMKSLGCSEAELSMALHKYPYILSLTEDKLCLAVEFLKTEVGLSTEYIVRRPALLSYSLKRRLIPRHYVIKVLMSAGLLEKDATDFFSVIFWSNERFSKKFLDPYKEAVPWLAAAYEEQVAPK